MESELVTVYSFEVPGEGGMEYVPFKATREAIDGCYRGRVIEGTDESLPSHLLDESGRYRPWPGGWVAESLQRLQ